MAQDALIQAASALGVTPEPAENFFDPSQSDRLVARYAPASPDVASSKMLADQAYKARQLAMHEAQFTHEQAVWKKQEKDMADQEAIDEGELLHTFAGLNPTLPKIGQDGKPILDSTGNPVMTINPDYTPTMSKMFADNPSVANNKAMQAMAAFKNTEHERVRANQYKEDYLNKSHADRTYKESQTIITRGLQKGMKEEDFKPAYNPLTKEFNTITAAELVGSFNVAKKQEWRENKETVAALNRKQLLFKDDIRALKTRTSQAKFFAPDGRPFFEKQYQNAADALMKEKLFDDEKTARSEAETSKTREGFVDDVVRPTAIDYNNREETVHSKTPPKLDTKKIAEWNRVQGLLEKRRRIASDYFDAVNELSMRDNWESAYQGLTGEELAPEPAPAAGTDVAPPAPAPVAPPATKPDVAPMTPAEAKAKAVRENLKKLGILPQ